MTSAPTRTATRTSTPPQRDRPSWVFPSSFRSTSRDSGKHVTRGLEVSTKIQATDKLRIDLGYAYEMMLSDTSLNEFGTPTHEIKEMATYTVNKKLSFDQAIYFAGANTDGNPAYTRFDFQLRYQAGKNCEASIGARNLGQGNFTEIGGNALGGANLVQPAIFGSVTVKF